VLATVTGVLLWLPVPHATVAEGIVWTADDAAVHAGAEGVVAELLAAPNSAVQDGDPLVRMIDPLLDARVDVLTARAKELELRYSATDLSDPVEARIIGEQLQHAQADLELALQRQQQLTLLSPGTGRFVVPQPKDWPGRFVRKGDTLGYVLRPNSPTIRVVVDEEEADLVRGKLEHVDVRFADRLGEIMPATIVREVPALTDTLPSMALSTLGGGDILIDPTDPQQMKVLANLLHLELTVDTDRQSDSLGGRVYVRFDHGYEPLAGRLYRSIRQVFLKQFNV
jgi:putative peptide zinc metalloprotease protein